MMDCDDEDEHDEDDDECDMSPQEKEQRRRIDEADKEYRARLRDLYKEYPKTDFGQPVRKVEEQETARADRAHETIDEVQQELYGEIMCNSCSCDC